MREGSLLPDRVGTQPENKRAAALRGVNETLPAKPQTLQLEIKRFFVSEFFNKLSEAC